MKRIAALFFFCSTTFLMGMIKDTDDISSKLTAGYKKFYKTAHKPFHKFLRKRFFLIEVLRKAHLWDFLTDSDCKNNIRFKKFYQKINDILGGKKVFRKLDFVSSNPINNEDYKKLDTILKFVSNENESICRESREEKEKYSIRLISYKDYCAFHESIAVDARLKAHSFKPIFTRRIREQENDKLNLLDVKIKTLH